MRRALAHPPRQQRLTDDVVELVRARVRQVLTFEQHPHPQALGQARHSVTGVGRPP